MALKGKGQHMTKKRVTQCVYFNACEPAIGKCPLMVVDLGFSSRNRSNGVVSCVHPEGGEYTFAEMIDVVVNDLVALLKDGPPLLAIEAPLSKLFVEGNPAFRFDREEGRGWWYGPGATVALGAIEMIERLSQDGRLAGKTVLLAEAFCSHKAEATGHVQDALLIYHNFWQTAPVNFPVVNARPISDLIAGIPPVRVFAH